MPVNNPILPLEYQNLGGNSSNPSSVSGSIGSYVDVNTVKSSGVQVGYNKQIALIGPTGYAVGTTTGVIVLGGSNLSLTIDQGGTYLINSRANMKYNQATLISPTSGQLSLFKNSGGVTGNLCSTSIQFRSLTTIIDEIGTIMLPQVIYSTPNNNDIIQMNAVMAVVPSAGTISVSEAEITAIRLY